MGLFDFLLSDEKKIKKHHRTLVNRDAQPEDREASALWLANLGNPEALLALISRLDMTLDHQLKNQAEVEQVAGLIAAKGAEALPSLVAWIRRCKKIAVPLQLIQDLGGQEQAIELVYELLEQERARDDFKPDKKRKLLVWLADVRHPGALAAATPFLEDFDEGVRYAAAEVLIAQDDPSAREPLLARLGSPDEDSNRLKVRLAEVFAQRSWRVSEDDLPAPLPGGYGVRDERIVLEA